MLWREFQFHIRHFPIADQKKIEEAFVLGIKAHQGQMRESGQPYFTHPVATAQTVAQMGGDRDTIIAALLHDTIEDTPLTIQEIEARFGSDVTNMINGVTKLEEHELENKPTMNEKIETLRKTFTLMEKDVRIMTIKLADRLHNMQTISFRSPEKQRAVAKETLDVYVKIADRLCMRDLRDELELLCRSILEPELHALLMDIRSRNRKKCQRAIDVMVLRMRGARPDLALDMVYEPQSWEKLLLQYELHKESESATAQLNIVLRCTDTAACYQTLGVIHQVWPRIVMTFEDFINTPAINGYKGIHTTIILEDGTHVRCKIRTHEMDDYARRGITTVCFDRRALGLLDYLPWTQHISPLSQDTHNRSSEFWETLQSDILSDSIIIYGNANKSVLVPKGATALDGALHLYPEDAIRLTGIRVNGREAPLSRVLERADIVEISCSNQKTVKREWLFWTQTGVGNAMIRSALSEEDWNVKTAMGKNLLQEYLLDHRRGFIAEFNAEYLARKLEERGLSNEIDKIYVQLAEGRLLPQDVERAIFRPANPDDHRRELWMLRYSIDSVRWQTVYDLLQQYRIKHVRLVQDEQGVRHVKIALLLTPEEKEELSQALQLTANVPFHLGRRRSALGRIAASVGLFLLWGLDPVLAHMLLQSEGLNPLNLTVIRFLSFVALSGTLLFFIQRKRPLPEVRLSLRSPSLWISALFLFLVSVTSYTALQGTMPSHYTIPMTAAGVFITSIVNRRRFLMLSATWLLVILGIALLITQTTGWTPWDIGFTLLAVLSFSGFSYISERYKAQEQVSLRTAQYLFLLSALCASISFPLLGFTGIHLLPPMTIVWSVLFSIFITGAPYYIYYYLLSHREIDFILRYSFLIIPATLIAQSALMGLPTIWTVLSALLITIGAILPLQKDWMRHREGAGVPMPAVQPVA